MSPDVDAQATKALLQGLGLSAHDIPESPDSCTPDLLVSESLGDTLIEVKSKEDDKGLRKLLDSPRGTPYPGSPGSVPAQIGKAWHQIRDFPGRTNAKFTAVWLIARKPHGMTILTGWLATQLLYGIELLEGYDTAGLWYEKPCYFLHPALFQSYRELDSVVIQDHQALTLCLNPLSPWYSEFRTSGLATAFRARFSVIDPPELETAGGCFNADSAGAAASLNERVGHLKAKYDLDTVTFERFVLYNEPAD
jgi:hypothetical protein